ncbi:MAG: aminomethyl-transferring glycine dehydrogenase subunit GcvPA, partial [bacterium]
MSYIPHNDKDLREMMQNIGVSSVEELFADIPAPVKIKGALKLPEALPEAELVRRMRDLSRQNKNVEDDYTCFLGAGAYDHFIPSVVGHVTGRSEFYTAYTPYQPELSQGILQAMFEYQSLICEITGLDVSNASLYDGATAVAEAANVARIATKRDKIIVSGLLHPEYRAVLKTYAEANGLRIVEVAYKEGISDIDKFRELADETTAGLIIQNPNFFGQIEDLAQFSEITRAKGALLIAVVYPISLGVLRLPGDCGADIVVGEGQSLGIPLSFGGPYLGLFACRQNLTRLMPGRVVGMTKDALGKQGYVLTLQTREQHIRREKAASNICSNEALCALAAAVY